MRDGEDKTKDKSKGMRNKAYGVRRRTSKE